MRKITIGKATLYEGDCLEVLSSLDASSIHACVTDPPYGLSFMGKKWDHDVPALPVWERVYSALKPGAHLLAFFGTRTYHRGVVPIEDAGFDIRDQIQWIYGSGFPKSHDVSKALDKLAGAEREVLGPNPYNALRGRSGAGNGTLAAPQAPSMVTTPASPEAVQWQGWGTALKPANEPIVMARKPLAGTVAANVVAHGTGALNIDGCRVEAPEGKTSGGRGRNAGAVGWQPSSGFDINDGQGRWPANVILDGSSAVEAEFPRVKTGKGSKHQAAPNAVYGSRATDQTGDLNSNGGDDGSAARFFYCAKPSRSERGEGNIHPTVKPVRLMAYLCRLVTPPEGVVLDPYAGSGTTGLAALQEGFHFVGIERDPAYFEIACDRLRKAQGL